MSIGIKAARSSWLETAIIVIEALAIAMFVRIFFYQPFNIPSGSMKETLLIGDSDTDVLTGRNAGVWTCGVTYGFGAHTLASAPPDFLIGDLRELPPLLDGKGEQTGEGSRQ